MGNIIDYLNWRGDLPFERDPVNRIDCLLFAQMSYLLWELVWQPGKTASLSTLYPKLADNEYAVTFTSKQDCIMLPIAARSTRFGTVPMSDFVSFLDETVDEQFAAVTFHLPDDSLVIAFRGTDCSLVGWKEDFKMACMPEVPSQGQASEYLRRIAGLYPGNIRIAGHSKGGNLAVYAAATAPADIQARLLDVLNFDGPGQRKALFASAGYANLSVIRTFVPVSSIIGMLMCHPSQMCILKSDAEGINQHNPYSWQLCGTDFLYAEDRNEESHFYEKVFERWLAEISTDERTAFVDTLFSVLASTKAHAFGNDFLHSLWQHPMEVLESLQNINKSTWQKVTKVIGALASSAVENSIGSLTHDERDALSQSTGESLPESGIDSLS